MRGRGDDRVGGGEASQRGVEPTGVEEVQSKRGFLALTGEFVVRAEGVRSVAYLAEGFVPTGCYAIQRGGGLDAAGIRGDRGTAEMVTETWVEPVETRKDSVPPVRTAMAEISF